MTSLEPTRLPPGGERPPPGSMQVPPNCDLTLGMSCLDKSEPGRSSWEMVADERFANPAGATQGGFLAAFCDSAMGASAVTFARRVIGDKVSCVNAELKVSFFRPATMGTRLRCDALVISGGERLCFCEAEVHDQKGRLVAKASSTYVVGRRKAEIGD